jgi:hypothetical protein
VLLSILFGGAENARKPSKVSSALAGAHTAQSKVALLRQVLEDEEANFSALSGAGGEDEDYGLQLNEQHKEHMSLDKFIG